MGYKDTDRVSAASAERSGWRDERVKDCDESLSKVRPGHGRCARRMTVGRETTPVLSFIYSISSRPISLPPHHVQFKRITSPHHSRSSPFLLQLHPVTHPGRPPSAKRRLPRRFLLDRLWSLERRLSWCTRRYLSPPSPVFQPQPCPNRHRRSHTRIPHRELLQQVGTILVSRHFLPALRLLLHSPIW